MNLKKIEEYADVACSVATVALKYTLIIVGIMAVVGLIISV